MAAGAAGGCVEYKPRRLISLMPSSTATGNRLSQHGCVRVWWCVVAVLVLPLSALGQAPVSPPLDVQAYVEDPNVQITPLPPVFATEAVAAVPPEPLPPAGSAERITLPLHRPPESIQVHMSGQLITLQARAASLQSVLSLLAEQLQLNLVAHGLESELVTVTLHDVPLDTVLQTILTAHGFTYHESHGVLVVSPRTKTDSDPLQQGRQIMVFPLNYRSARELMPVVQQLLSPLGTVYAHEVQTGDVRLAHEQLAVEDQAIYLQRIHEYLIQADQPPAQVQVEAHILQVMLQDNCRHGVDFDQLLRLANSEINVQSLGYANAGGPGHLIRLRGTDLTSVLDLLQNTTDAKTLASPKVTVINGQESRMQVGGKIGYRLTTTTQTSTQESVNFLEYGVILTVTPNITQNGQIMMRVMPQVSTGRINQQTELPESETTEVETTVMLNDGEALIIGGLIKEADSETQSKLPILGNIKYIGRLFQRRSANRERSEVIITLLPRIVQNSVPVCEQDLECQQRAMTPLVMPDLSPVDRRHWEPTLPSALPRFK